MELMRRMSMYTLRHMSCTCASILMSSAKWNPRHMLGKNRGFDLNVMSRQADSQRMSFDEIRKWLYVKNEQNRL